MPHYIWLVVCVANENKSSDDVVSTIGFSKYELRLRQNRFKIILYDVGGSVRIRSIWHNYYSLVHGIIFVIDSADLDRILEVKQLLQELASNPLILGKPILM
ncbi:ADP-ribosylation factor-like protein 13B-like protein [Euroglyphus maynei]|uniref:ADP-ribosylation factor-like protein 13B-like protein n=1 Tax=Euroglyphus maynei TaxID=6958 RepID=A0A1Y3AZ69_EURMA|nr:ADP-ribosylation factor-like protein 13B-like protein [Euroglyphus maynei]